MDRSLPGSFVHGILQARLLEGLPFPSPGHLPDPGIEPGCPALQADSLLSKPPGKPQSDPVYVGREALTLQAGIQGLEAGEEGAGQWAPMNN